jgi:UDP-glucuronate 4-epimerase
MKYLITGVAGFIGFHLTKALLEKGETVVGIDNMNRYYDIRLKYARLNEISKYPNFLFIKADIADKVSLKKIFRQNNFDIVCNLAAQASVTYSTINPDAYIHSNILGFINILECCRDYKTRLIYASSSSVYGDNKKLPFSETDLIITPKSLYAKTKLENENLAEMYSSHFGLQAVGLRFFSVYGTWGRPDMVMWIFTKSILEDIPLQVHGNGEMERDFTFVGDVVECILKIIDCISQNRQLHSMYNIASANPINLIDLISKLEKNLNKKAIKIFQPMKPEEVKSTCSDISRLFETICYKPQTHIDMGIKIFIEWYRDYFRLHENIYLP